MQICTVSVDSNPGAAIGIGRCAGRGSAKLEGKGERQWLRKLLREEFWERPWSGAEGFNSPEQDDLCVLLRWRPRQGAAGAWCGPCCCCCLWRRGRARREPATATSCTTMTARRRSLVAPIASFWCVTFLDPVARIGSGRVLWRGGFWNGVIVDPSCRKVLVDSFG